MLLFFFLIFKWRNQLGFNFWGTTSIEDQLYFLYDSHSQLFSAKLLIRLMGISKYDVNMNKWFVTNSSIGDEQMMLAFAYKYRQ